MSAVGWRDGDEHRAWDELAVGWTLHALEPEDEAVFSAHLAGCARCAQTAAETTDVMAAMAGDLPQAEPSDELRERLRGAVERTEQLPPRQPVERRPVALPAGPTPAVPPVTVRGNSARDVGGLRPPLHPRAVDPRLAWRRVLPTALVAAAVAAVLALGAWNVVLTSDRDAAESVAAERSQILDRLLAGGTVTVAPLTDDGRAVATVLAEEGELQVVASGLAVNDRDDTTYVVWGMRSGLPEAIGTFDVVTARMDLRPVGSTATGLDDYSAYGISIEPGRQAPSAPTDIVATGQVTS